MSQVYFSTAAMQDVREIHKFIAANNVDAAVQLLNEIETACQKLVRFPQSGLTRDDLMPGLRLIVVRKSYVVFYRSSNEDIEVVRIIHGARDYSKLFDF